MPNIKDYDDASIRACGNFAEDFFNNFDKYKNQYKPSVIFSDLSFDILRKKNALENYILKYYSRLDDNHPIDASIKRNMDKYLQALYKRFVSDPTELLGSPFLKSPKTVDIYCPAEIQIKGASVDLRQKVKETYRDNVKNSKELYIRDRNSNSLSKEDTDRLMHFLISNIGTDNQEIQSYQEEYLKKLISQKSKVSELSIKQVEFIAKYVNNLMLNSRLKELGYNRNDIQERIYIGKESPNLGGYESSNNIYININSSLTTDIPSLIHVVCHETEHSIQGLEATNNSKSKIGLDSAISTVLRNYYSSQKGYDVYHNNYRFEQIEEDSEHIGFHQAIIILDTLGFKDEANKLKAIKKQESDTRRFEYDYRIDENGKKCTRETFFFNSLNTAIANQPELVSQYPALSLLYTQDGKVKPFEDIITGDFKLNDNAKNDNIADFCKYYISQGALDKLDLHKFPDDVQARIASRLISILGNEKLQIADMNKNQAFSRDVAEDDKRRVEGFHLKNCRNIMRFMNRNYQLFMELQDNGSFSSIINMDYYNSHVKTFSYTSSYENLAYNNQSNIEALQQLALEAEENKNIYRANKKQSQTFSPNTLDASFDSLVANTNISGFQNATQTIKTLTSEYTLSHVEDMEKK